MGCSSKGNSPVCNCLSHHTYPDLNTLLLGDVKPADGLRWITFHILRKSLFTNEDEFSAYSDNFCVIVEFCKYNEIREEDRLSRRCYPQILDIAS